MERTVTPHNAYQLQGSELVKIGKGITHYRLPWVEGMEGGRPALRPDDEPTGMYAELLAAGIEVAGPPVMRTDDVGPYLDVTILLDDGGKWSDAVQSVADAHVADVPARLEARAVAAQVLAEQAQPAQAEEAKR